MFRRSLLCISLLCCVVLAAEPCVSGPRVGQRPGPYSSVICTGDNRGKSHCYICETEDRPAIIVFARSMSDPLGKLLQGVDKAMATYSKNDLRSWVTMLHNDQSKVDDEVVKFSKKHGLRSVAIGVYEDVEGPPSYRIHKSADLTVLLYVKQKVVVNQAFRSGELSEAKIKEIIDAIPRITGPVKK